jgi:hypothetical protein
LNKPKQIINTETAELSFYASDVILTRFKSDKLVSLEDAKEIDRLLMKMANGKSYYFISDALDASSNMTSDAQKYFSRFSDISKYNIGMAILLNNLPVRLTASIFIKFHKPIYPAKIFGDYKAAMNWIDGMRIKKV